MNNKSRKKSFSLLKKISYKEFKGSLLRYVITVFSCVMIITMGTGMLAYATTSIGENIVTNILTATGLIVDGNATTTGTLNAEGGITGNLAGNVIGNLTGTSTNAEQLGNVPADDYSTDTERTDALDDYMALSGGIISGDLTVSGNTVLATTSLATTTISALSSVNGNIKYVQTGETIQSVVDGITDASETNPYTIIIPPGVFKETVVLKDYINLIGSGRKSTIITGGGGSRCIEPANENTIANIGIDGVTYQGEGKSCSWNIGTPNTHSDETFYVRNCWFNSPSSFVHTEGNNVVGHVFDCTGETVFDGYVAVGNTELFVHDCWTQILYHETFTRKIFVVSGDGAKVHAFNCYVYANLSDIGSNIKIAEAYSSGSDTGLIELHNCIFDVTIASGSGYLYGLYAYGVNQEIIAHGSAIRLSYLGTGQVYGAMARFGTIKFYNSLVVNTGIITTSSIGMRSNGANSVIDVFGGSVSTPTRDLQQLSDGTINVYGTKYTTSGGTIVDYKSHVPASTGSGSIKMGSANNADSAGFIEISPGKFIPYWTDATP